MIGAPRQTQSRHKFTSLKNIKNLNHFKDLLEILSYRICEEQEAQTGTRAPGPTETLLRTPRPLLGADKPEADPLGDDPAPEPLLPASGGGRDVGGSGLVLVVALAVVMAT